jgi:hypothetical protein
MSEKPIMLYLSGNDVCGENGSFSDAFNAFSETLHKGIFSTDKGICITVS